MKNIEGLISVLDNNPAITHVHFDKNGGWLFVPNNLHPIVKTRDEVINEYLQAENADSKQETPSVDNTGKGSKKSK